MEEMNKLKVGDFVLKTDLKGNFPFDFDVCKIDKISKDGTKARGLTDTFNKNLHSGITYDFPLDTQDYRKILIDYMEKKDIDYPILVTQECHSSFAIVDGQPTEDDYDDVIHFDCLGCAFKYEAKHIKDIPNGTQVATLYRNCDIHLYFTKSIQDMADYIIQRFNLRVSSSLENDVKEWLRLNGSSFNNLEDWKDYFECYEQLEWAIHNGVTPSDYDEWQATQRVLKHELKFDTAIEITKVLYEMEELNIFDCE